MALLRENKPFIVAALPAVLDDFYRHIAKFSETAALFKSREHMAHAKQMQMKHWVLIAEGRFDAQYEASVDKIGEAHNRLLYGRL